MVVPHLPFLRSYVGETEDVRTLTALLYEKGSGSQAW